MPKFTVERRPLPVKADLEGKMEWAFRENAHSADIAAAKARADVILAVLKAEPQRVQERVQAELKAMLGKKYATASKKPGKDRRGALQAAGNALFKGEAA